MLNAIITEIVVMEMKVSQLNQSEVMKWLYLIKGGLTEIFIWN